jgi:hypothetical protein
MDRKPFSYLGPPNQPWLIAWLWWLSMSLMEQFALVLGD